MTNNKTRASVKANEKVHQESNNGEFSLEGLDEHVQHLKDKKDSMTAVFSFGFFYEDGKPKIQTLCFGKTEDIFMGINQLLMNRGLLDEYAQRLLNNVLKRHAEEQKTTEEK